MSDRTEIDDSLPATLYDAGNATHCPTFQEAVIALAHLPIERQKNATIRIDGGAVYTARDIEKGLFRLRDH